MIYFNLISSNLTYCITAWGGCQQNSIYPVKLVKKRIVRAIHAKPRLAPIGPLFASLNVLNLEPYKYVHGKLICLQIYVPDEVRVFTRRTINCYELRGTENINLVVPLAPCVHPQQSLQYIGPATFNGFPAEIRNNDVLSSFKFQLKNICCVWYKW